MRTIKDLQHQNKNQELVILERQDERLYNQIFELENTLSFNSKTALKWFNYPRFRLYGILRSNRVVGIVAATQDYSMPYRNALEESTSIMCTYLSAGYLHPRGRGSGLFEKFFDSVLEEEKKRGSKEFGAIIREENSPRGECPSFFKKRGFEKIGESTVHNGPAIYLSIEGNDESFN
ncbi:MAG: hypothetical protein UR15_C0012G0002 [Parcubacteria group bacterium GW2011_GWA2_31_28]|nr:MAG: hypothetical protein UR15_C0012G0002 [Parcubacteria group bacterium GW2011_GWA2_31_28]